jgi:LPXTG-motif cell wall-anchored protein
VLPEKKNNLNNKQKDSPTLPSTGAQNTWIIALALVLLLFGFVSIFTSKKEGFKNEA